MYVYVNIKVQSQVAQIQIYLCMHVDVNYVCIDMFAFMQYVQVVQNEMQLLAGMSVQLVKRKNPIQIKSQMTLTLLKFAYKLIFFTLSVS